MVPPSPLTAEDEEHISQRRDSDLQSMVEDGSGLPDIPFVRLIPLGY
jgi:hypothetical protein